MLDAKAGYYWAVTGKDQMSGTANSQHWCQTQPEIIIWDV